MLRSLSSSLIGALLLVACSTDQPAASPAAPTVSQPTTTSSPGPVSPSTTLASPTTTSTATNVDDSITPDIDSAVPEKHLENYLAALAAGAYEQAGFPATNAGTAFGDNENIAAADYLGAACEPDLCNGPYTVEPDDPFIQYDGIAPPRWNFSVTHEQSGQTATMSVGMFEGQFVIADLPPLVESPRPDDLLTQLFGSDRPDYAVVERFDAFEVWTADTTTWATNWFAKDTWLVEGDVAVSYGVDGVLVTPLAAPPDSLLYQCLDIVVRDGRMLVWDSCDPTAPGLYELGTADLYPFLIDPSEIDPFESGSVGYLERGGIAVATLGDAEGNTSELISTTGADLLGGDYAGYRTLSADGRRFVYSDHSQGSGTYNHFWSPVVVVRATDTGAELVRLVLDGPVTCLESDGLWVLACEGDVDRMLEGDPGIMALVAYNVETGETNRVATRTRVFLPSEP